MAKTYLNHNIKALRRNIGISQTQLAKRLKVSRWSVGEWESGHREPIKGNLEELAEYFSGWFDVPITPDHLREKENLVGIVSAAPSIRNPFFYGAPTAPRAKPDYPSIREAIDTLSRAVTEHERQTVTTSRPEVNIIVGHNAVAGHLVGDRSKFVPIPLYRDPARVAAGHGSVFELIDSEDIEGYAVIWADWVRHPEQCITIRVRGDSMYPILIENSIICVDFSQSNVDALRDRIVVVRLSDGGVVVKYLRRQADGFLLEPANHDYPTEKLNTARGDVIIGRVIWHWTPD